MKFTKWVLILTIFNFGDIAWNWNLSYGYLLAGHTTKMISKLRTSNIAEELKLSIESMFPNSILKQM